MESYEAMDFSRRGRIIIFLALLQAQGLEKLADCQRLVVINQSRGLTPLRFHISTTETLVEKSNAESNVHAHAFFVDLPGQSILDQNICRVGPELVTTIGDFGDDLGIPFSLGLTRGDEASHDNVVDLPPILTCTRSDMRDDVGIGSLLQPGLMADWAFSNLDDMLFAALIREIIFPERVALVRWDV